MKEISDQAKIESFVGTVSGGKGHFHLSVSNKHGEMVGGHVFGPVLASGTVHVVIGECRDLLLTRSHDQQTGYPELVVLEQDIDLPTDSHKPTTNSQSKKTVDNDSSVMVYAFRLGPGQDICEGLKKFASENKLKTPSIMTCVGSVTKAVIIDLNQHGTQVNPAYMLWYIGMVDHVDGVSVVYSRYGVVCYSMTWYGIWLGIIWYAMVMYGMTQYSMARYGMGQ